MGREQGGHVLRGWLVLILDGMQHAPSHVASRSPSWSVSTANVTTPGASTDADGADRGLVVQQQHLLEADVADLGRLAERRAGRGQRHLAVGSPRKGGHIVDLMVAQPWQRRGADFSLPGVALRLLGQPHVRAPTADARQPCRRPAPGVLTVAGQQQPTVGPRWQWRVHQPPAGYSTEKSTAAPALCRSARKPRSPCGSACSRRMPANAATGMSSCVGGLLDSVG